MVGRRPAPASLMAEPVTGVIAGSSTGKPLPAIVLDTNVQANSPAVTAAAGPIALRRASVSMQAALGMRRIRTQSMALPSSSTGIPRSNDLSVGAGGTPKMTKTTFRNSYIPNMPMSGSPVAQPPLPVMPIASQPLGFPSAGKFCEIFVGVIVTIIILICGGDIIRQTGVDEADANQARSVFEFGIGPKTFVVGGAYVLLIIVLSAFALNRLVSVGQGGIVMFRIAYAVIIC